MVRQAERWELSVKIALPTGTDHCDSRLKVVLFPEGSLVNKEVMGMLLSSMKKFLLIYSQKLIFFFFNNLQGYSSAKLPAKSDNLGYNKLNHTPGL